MIHRNASGRGRQFFEQGVDFLPTSADRRLDLLLVRTFYGTEHFADRHALDRLHALQRGIIRSDPKA